MTSNDYYVVMTEEVGIADLKAHLSEHLRKVRNGETLTVLDRDTPIAQIAPVTPDAALEVRKATRKPADLPLPLPPSTPTDSLSALLADRASR
jgi:antitoxin (DNA-binding transcriptional repressor) of toxin-antitoxin stability system